MTYAIRGLLTIALLLLCSCSFFTPVSTLSFTPKEVPVAKVGEPYSQKIKISGNITPVGGIEITPQLPPGLEYKIIKGNDAVLIITGTPLEIGETDLKVEAWSYGTMTPGRVGIIIYKLKIIEAVSKEKANTDCD